MTQIYTFGAKSRQLTDNVSKNIKKVVWGLAVRGKCVQWRHMSDLTLTATSGFASLLATEDVSVVVNASAETASFDLESRTVTMPVWREMSTQLTDMLIGHEVSHALHTTCDLPATIDHIAGRLSRTMPQGLIMGALNVVEDVRIDKLIQRRYRGLVSDYVVGYTEMRNMDLFGVGEENPNEREFLDRLNLHAKGYRGEIAFCDDEENFVERAENAEEFGEVVDLVVDILNWLPENDQSENNPEVTEGDGPAGGEGDSAGGESQSTGEQGDDTENNASGETGEQDGEGSGEGSEEGVESKGDGSMESAADAEDDGSTAEGDQSGEEANGDNGGNGFADQMPSTADAMADGLKNLAAKADPENKWSHPVRSHTMPKDSEFAKTAFAERGDYRKEIDALVDASLKNRYHSQANAKVLAKYDTWASDARVSVNQMAMEFERKQAAHIDQRTQVGKSGRLDMSKLHNYKLSEDLFMRTEMRPNGKNHAMTIVIDWSGSMSDKVISTMRQACILAMFCKKVNVPCEVYLFQSGHQMLKDTNAYDRGMCRHVMVLNTADRTNLFNADIKRAWVLAEAVGGRTDLDYPMNYRLGGTPLGCSLVLAEKTHRELIARTGAEVSSIIYLTDGDGCDFVERGRKQTNIVCPRTRRTFTGVDSQSATLSWIRETLGCNVVNFYMTGMKQAKYDCSWGKDSEARTESLKANNFFEKGEIKGWDNWLVVADNVTRDYDNGEDLIDKLDDKASKVKIRNAFIKQMSNRGMSRPLVNRITEMIA